MLPRYRVMVRNDSNGSVRIRYYWIKRKAWQRCYTVIGEHLEWLDAGDVVKAQKRKGWSGWDTVVAWYGGTHHIAGNREDLNYG